MLWSELTLLCVLMSTCFVPEQAESLPQPTSSVEKVVAEHLPGKQLISILQHVEVRGYSPQQLQEEAYMAVVVQYSTRQLFYSQRQSCCTQQLWGKAHVSHGTACYTEYDMLFYRSWQSPHPCMDFSMRQLPL